MILEHETDQGQVKEELTHKQKRALVKHTFKTLAEHGVEFVSVGCIGDYVFVTDSCRNRETQIALLMELINRRTLEISLANLAFIKAKLDKVTSKEKSEEDSDEH